MTPERLSNFIINLINIKGHLKPGMNLGIQAKEHDIVIRIIEPDGQDSE
jgi:hypothetical protein